MSAGTRRRTPQWHAAMTEAEAVGVSPGRLAELREDSTLAEVRAEAAAARPVLDYDPEYYRLWQSPNRVDHLVNRRTGGCMTCGRYHEVTK